MIRITNSRTGADVFVHAHDISRIVGRTSKDYPHTRSLVTFSDGGYEYAREEPATIAGRVHASLRRKA